MTDDLTTFRLRGDAFWDRRRELVDETGLTSGYSLRVRLVCARSRG